MTHRTSAVALMSAVVALSLGLGARTSEAREVDAKTTGSTPASPSTPPAECSGCTHTAGSVKVIDVQSTFYNAGHINRVFSGRLTECYRKAGWHPNEEKQLDYLVGYNATTGRVTSIKGAMFGRAANPDLLACVRKELVELEIGKVRKDSEVVGFSMTVRAE